MIKILGYTFCNLEQILMISDVYKTRARTYNFYVKYSFENEYFCFNTKAEAESARAELEQAVKKAKGIVE